MNIHTKFNIGDKVYYIYSHGTGGSNKPFYVTTELFTDREGKEVFEVTGIEINAGEGYCNIDYVFKDFHEIFKPSEYCMFYTKEEALSECKKRSINSLKQFMQIRECKSPITKKLCTRKAYEDELKLLETEVN